jgi:hypothetical protein
MSYGQMLYGAGLSAVLALALVAVPGRCRRPAVLAFSALAAFLMPLAWNAILRQTGATGLFSHDLRFRPFPISWQDTGSGIFTLAGAAMLLALGPGRNDQPPRVTALALWTALGALLIDIYSY